MKNNIISYIKVQYLKPYYVIYYMDKVQIEGLLNMPIDNIMALNKMDIINIAVINKIKPDDLISYWNINRNRVINNFYGIRQSIINQYKKGV